MHEWGIVLPTTTWGLEVICESLRVGLSSVAPNGTSQTPQGRAKSLNSCIVTHSETILAGSHWACHQSDSVRVRRHPSTTVRNDSADHIRGLPTIPPTALGSRGAAAFTVREGRISGLGGYRPHSGMGDRVHLMDREFCLQTGSSGNARGSAGGSQPHDTDESWWT